MIPWATAVMALLVVLIGFLIYDKINTNKSRKKFIENGAFITLVVLIVFSAVGYVLVHWIFYGRMVP